MKYYTNVFINKGKIYIRGIENGKHFARIEKYKPYLFVNSQENTEYKNTQGQNVLKLDFDSIWEAKEFLQQYKDVEGMPIYGLTRFEYVYLYDRYKTKDYDAAEISVVGLDIETKLGTEDIATAVSTTPNEITAITISKGNKLYSFGCKDFKPHLENVIYFKCNSEKELLQKFIEIWVSCNPDVVTGWNIEFFDIPYLVGRINRILGEEYVNRLSPWGIVKPYDVDVKGRKITSYQLMGISTLDYLVVYKKFILSPRESYRLDYITEVELEENKINYKDEGYINLDDLYDRNFQRYLEYNIHDVVLINKLEDKLKLIELVFAMAYDAKINYNDTFGTVLQWDIIIHNYLMDEKTVIPQQSNRYFTDFAGGYVKEPKVGMHKWVVSCDLNSLYPHLIQQYNISPETFVERINIPSINDLLAGVSVPLSEYSIAANGCAYLKTKQGFLGALMEKMYKDRQAYKKQMLKVEQEYENTKNPILKKEIARLNSLQHSKKIQLNAAYGALGNRYFRWFDINHAEAITLSGQLSIQWIANKLNTYLNKICNTISYDYIIASDTDSVYISFENLIQIKFKDEQSDTLKIVKWLDKFCQEILEPFIEKSYQQLAEHMNAYAQKMKMKREAIADVAIWTAKKRYIMNVWNNEGVSYEKPKLKMVGIEAIRSSTPKSCRDAIKKAIEMIINTDEQTVQKYIQEYKDIFKTLTFEEIAFPRGVSDLGAYSKKSDGFAFEKGCPIHVKGSILYNYLINKYNLIGQYEFIGNGDKIKFCYLKKPNPYGSNVISSFDELPKEFILDKYLDFDTQFNIAFIKPLSIILDSIGWHTEKKVTLEGFFE